MTLWTQTLGELVGENPARSRVFEKFGLDYCCGGRATLEAACAKNALAVETLVRELEACDAAQPHPALSPSTLSLSALVDHIEQTHHAYLHQELPRLTGLIEKVVRAHGASHPYLIELEANFRLFREELEHHLFKEERILFPWIRRRETETPAQLATEPLHASPIHLLEAEHDEAGKALVAFRHLTSGYTPPADACGTFRALLEALAALEEDMHRHVHLENSILFPRDLALEAALK